MADDKTTKTPEQPVTDSGPGKETPPAPPKEPEKVSVSPEPEKKTEPEVKNPQVSVYNFAEIMKEKKVERITLWFDAVSCNLRCIINHMPDDKATSDRCEDTADKDT